jgi:hypothetical protein
MSIFYGEDNQIEFFSEEEEKEAIEFLRKRPKTGYVEPNTRTNSWGDGYRFQFGENEEIPECLSRQLKTQRRINCRKLYEKVYEDNS